MDKKIYCLYGSQTGNSESIAKDLAEKLSTVESIPTECMTLNAAKGMQLRESCLLLVIVCSTTGNADSPENADSWWRSVKLRSAAKDMFSGIDYVVLGLGDTNYDKFCHMGKSIDKRLSELGGNRRHPLTCADEATGLEEPVEAWKITLLSLAKEVYNNYQQQFLSTTASPVTSGVEEVVGEGSNPVDVEAAPQDLGSAESKAEEEDPLLALLKTLPTNVMTLKQVVEELNIVGQYEEFTKGATNGAVKASAESTAIRLLGKNFEPNESKPQPPPPPPPISTPSSTSNAACLSEWTVDKPFYADVLTAKWLTNPAVSRPAFHEASADHKQWGSNKRVVYCEISTKASNIAYLPGDSIGVCCPNPPYAVDAVLQRLQLTHPQDALTLQSAIALRASNTPAGEDGEVLSLGEFLRFRVDLTSIPKKASVTALATACTDPVERLQILYLTGKDKVQRSVWNAFVESQGLGIAELLAQFPSCRPSLPQLLAACPKPVPRYYSIASSPLRKPDSVTISFSLVRNQFVASANAKQAICRAGVCTSYLEYILRYWLYPAETDSTAATSSPVYHNPSKVISATEPIRLFHKANPNFRLPGSVSHPLVLIGPGTGVVPFISFLEHRYQIELERTRHSEDKTMSSGVWRGGFELDESDLPCESNKVNSFICSVKPNDIWLFYGCRNEDDYLFREDIDFFLDQHALTHLEVAMSRLPTAEKKCYVTDKLREQSQRVYELMNNGYIYICGDGNAMAKDVQNVLKEIVQRHHPTQPCSEEEANNVLNEMRTRRRLLLDIWS